MKTQEIQRINIGTMIASVNFKIVASLLWKIISIEIGTVSNSFKGDLQ